VQAAYELLTEAKAEFSADSAVAGLEAAYARDENDEFVKATAIRDSASPYGGIIVKDEPVSITAFI
jgi:bisphosphoglycerate-independent phosphoglycerate mutase (AlkP superfamily)